MHTTNATTWQVGKRPGLQILYSYVPALSALTRTTVWSAGMGLSRTCAWPWPSRGCPKTYALGVCSRCMLYVRCSLQHTEVSCPWHLHMVLRLTGVRWPLLEASRCNAQLPKIFQLRKHARIPESPRENFCIQSPRLQLLSLPTRACTCHGCAKAYFKHSIIVRRLMIPLGSSSDQTASVHSCVLHSRKRHHNL